MDLIATADIRDSNPQELCIVENNNDIRDSIK